MFNLGSNHARPIATLCLLPETRGLIPTLRTVVGRPNRRSAFISKKGSGQTRWIRFFRRPRAMNSFLHMKWASERDCETSSAAFCTSLAIRLSLSNVMSLTEPETLIAAITCPELS